MSKGEDTILKDLNKTTTPEEAQQMMINLINPQCRDIAKKFFTCLDGKVASFDPEKTKYEEMEKKMNDIYVPECMNLHNLEECLKKFEH
jgi:hypothetical protein